MEMQKRPLIILTGPTAAGKTALSILLAKAISGEIISADSIQIYKEMNIGSARITLEEMDGVPHYLVDELKPDEEFNVYRFQKMAKAAIETIYQKGRLPIIVGGTGFYIQSVLYDIAFTENENDITYRRKLEEMAAKSNAQNLHDELRKIDPESAQTIHPNNIKRVIRALEYFRQTGEKISAHNEKEHQKTSPYDFVYFVLNDERSILYERINKRVLQMVGDGLVEEVAALKEKGYTSGLLSMQGIGYKEMYQHLNGELSLDECIELIQKETRHFAKRQITWFRREKDVTWLNWNEYGYNKDIVLNEMLDILKEKNMIE